MQAKYLAYAEQINRAYNIPSTFNPEEHYDYMFFYDDDIVVMLQGLETYVRLKEKNPNLKMVVVGGEGLLATAFKIMRLSLTVQSFFNPSVRRFKNAVVKENEAQRLKRIAMTMGIPEDDIITADTATNTTDILRNMSRIADGQKSLVVVTQRLAMFFHQSAEFQCNQHPDKFDMQPFRYDLLIIKQSVKESQHWYNFQRAGNGLVSLHLFVSIVSRFEVYDGKFLNKPFEPDKDTKYAAETLEKEFLIKQRLHGFKAVRAYFQYLPVIWDIWVNAKNYVRSEQRAVNLHLYYLNLTRAQLLKEKRLQSAASFL